MTSASLSAAMAGKNILIFRPYGVAANHFAVEQAVCGQLGLLGANVSWLICNGTFSECDHHWQLINPADKKDACNRCVGFAIAVKKHFKLEMTGLGEVLNESDYAYVDQWLSAMSPEDYFTAELEGWTLGDWVQSSVNTQLRCAEIIIEDENHAKAYRSYLRSAALTAIALRQYLSLKKIDALFLMNGRTAASRTVFEIARALSLPVAVHEFGRSEETRCLFLNENCLSLQSWNRHWNTWKNIPLSDTEISITQGLLRSRLEGTVDFSFNKKNTGSIAALLGPTRGKKIVSLFTSSTDEIASATDWQWPFTQLEWIREVVKYFRARPEYLLVIRCHPNHDHHFFGRDSQFLDALPTLMHEGGENIRIFMPSEQINSYDLVQASSAALVFSSTVAIEASLLSVKTMMAGGGPHQGRRLAYEFTGNLDVFPEALTQFLDDGIDEQWRINAARWLYLRMFRYVYDVPQVTRNGPHLACKQEAFTVSDVEWPLLKDLVKFFNEGDVFEQRPVPATLDGRDAEAERLAINTRFNLLRSPKIDERCSVPGSVPDVSNNRISAAILVLDPEGDAAKIERTLQSLLPQAAGLTRMVVLTTLPAFQFENHRNLELIFVPKDAYAKALEQLANSHPLSWNMLLRAGDSVNLASTKYLFS